MTNRVTSCVEEINVKKTPAVVALSAGLQVSLLLL